MATAVKEKIEIRPPVVAIVGHVDHGKTTLLDYIRKTNVASREAGGITQAVDAYEIEHAGKKITFIDTPGHEAFIAMRTRGAHIADLAVLVVAADEGVKPQTKESIKILTETETPFIVALNKIDRKEANVEKVKGELLEAGVALEGFGGQVSFHGISAKTGEGVSDLLDLLVLAADVEHLTCDPTAPASGYILETKRDRQRGNEVALIIKNGTLHLGDYISTPAAKGRVKILEDFKGAQAKELRASSPALVLGFEEMPAVGEEFRAGGTEESAASAHASGPAELTATIDKKAEDKNSLRLIMKAGDAGSLEALSLILKNLSGERTLAVLGESVGDVTDGDVKLASATGATIIGFKVRVTSAAKTLSDAQKVRIVTSNIIYDLVKSVEEFLKKPEIADAIGELEVLAIFNQKKQDKQVVGGKVAKGVVRTKAPFEVMRGEVNVGRGRIVGLQTGKKDTTSVPEGNEAGLMVNAGVMIEKGDRLIIKS